MASFKSHNIEDFTDTCKFWKVVPLKKETNDYYVGCTSGSTNCCALDDDEEYLFNHYQSSYITEFVRNNGDWDKCSIRLIEECPWQNTQHADTRQKELVALSPNATTNHCKRCRAKQEEYDIKQNKIEKGKQYDIDNADKIKARTTKQVVCDVCGSQFQHGAKSRHMKTNKHQLALNNKRKEIESNH